MATHRSALPTPLDRGTVLPMDQATLAASRSSTALPRTRSRRRFGSRSSSICCWRSSASSSRLDLSLYRILQILGLTLFEKTPKWGYPFDSGNPRCSMLGEDYPGCGDEACGGLSAGCGRIRGAFATEEACRDYLFRLRCRMLSLSTLRARALAGAQGVVAVRPLRAAELGDRRHDLPGHPQAAAAVVPGDSGGSHGKERASALGGGRWFVPDESD